MKQTKHIPIRKCIGCGVQKSKSEFVMIVRPPRKSKDKKLHVEIQTQHKDGRAAYLCKNAECLKKIKKSRKIEKTFSCKVEPEIYAALEMAVKPDE